MTVTPRELDFTFVHDVTQHRSGKLGHTSGVRSAQEGNMNAPRLPNGKLLTPKQVRARARRRMKRSELMSEDEFNAVFKPIDEWDLEELAKGRPRDSKGGFRGPAPKWITQEVHERSMERFKRVVKGEMQGTAVSALKTLDWVLTHDEVDEKGKPIVPASTKLDAAKFLLEHVVGKPTQEVKQDISVRLQSILAVAMGNPDQVFNGEGYSPSHLPGVTMAMHTEADEVLEGDFSEG